MRYQISACANDGNLTACADPRTSDGHNHSARDDVKCDIGDNLRSCEVKLSACASGGNLTAGSGLSVCDGHNLSACDDDVCGNLSAGHGDNIGGWQGGNISACDGDDVGDGRNLSACNTVKCDGRNLSACNTVFQ